MKKITLKLSVYGIVQGVGFRPYVYTLAKKLKLNGSVQNCLDKVEIVVSGDNNVIEQFKSELINNLPPIAQISNLNIEVIDNNNFTEFKILASSNFINPGSIQNAVLPADLKICKDCLAELIDPKNFRFNYPFINCTNCGPRISIIKGLPYDRQNTSMVDFKLCAVCLAEYEDPLNRRFHAQPIACKNCGPQLIFQDETNLCFADEAFNMAIQALNKGKLIAVKGLGGFHLSCDALNLEAINYLRKVKQRPVKPLALMMLDVNMVSQYCHLSKYQEKILTSCYAPIVLLDKKANNNLPELIAPNLVNLGVMLAYTPLHHMLIAKLNRPIIATSANLSDEPIVIENEEAKSRLQNITKVFLMHNRDILHRYDDSVVNTVNDQIQVIRMGRGLAPYFLSTAIENKYNILALGANQKNTFCLLTGHKAILSQHIGDLENVEAQKSEAKTIEFYLKLFNFKPHAIAIDLHENYLSSKLGLKLSKTFNIPLIKIQHHMAHIASTMVSRQLKEDVIGVAFDGSGWGIDHTLWGGEFFVGNLHNFTRIAYFKPFPLPGGALSIKQNWRTLYGLILVNDLETKLDLVINNLISKFGQKTLNIVKTQIKQKINTPYTSSCGRLFDAVSALLNICQQQHYEGQAPIELMQRAKIYLNNNSPTEPKFYNYFADSLVSNSELVINPCSIIQAMANEISLGMSVDYLAYKFHLTIANIVLSIVQEVASRSNINKVCLGGGVFQNEVLLNLCCRVLENASFKVYYPNSIPLNDAGIALGQAGMASYLLRKQLSQVK